MNIGDVKIGKKALIRIDGKLIRVLVGRQHPKGGWVCTKEDGEVLQVRIDKFVGMIGVGPPKKPTVEEVTLAIAEENQQRVVEQRKLRVSSMLKDARKREEEQRSRLGKHIIVEARAGTGKTFTLVEGVKRIYQGATKGVIGSHQQEMVWEAMLRGSKPESACFVAFNRSIADHLATLIPSGCSAMTLHSLGRSAIAKHFKLRRDSIKGYCTSMIIENITGIDIREMRKEKKNLVTALTRLTELCKLTLSNPSEETLRTLCGRYDVEIDGIEDDVLNLVPEILKKSREISTTSPVIDFADMIWLPCVLDLKVDKYDLLLVDEAQDLNRCQQALAMRAGRRLVMCGDPKQAIYGFAGADTESMTRMQGILEADGGCTHLPLTVTRRCGQEIVKLAQQECPEFEAFPTNPLGEIEYDMPQSEALAEMNDGDMVLCRTNAPLVSLVFRLIRSKKKANIQGRNIGESLWEFIEGLGASNLIDLEVRLDEYYQREREKLQASKWATEAQEIALSDKVQCVKALSQEASLKSKVVLEIKYLIDSIFSDTTKDGVRLSSVHRAKGLEARRVFIIEPGKLPHPMAKSDWQKEQERNLWYVAVTRAIEYLIFVQDSKKQEIEE